MDYKLLKLVKRSERVGSKSVRETLNNVRLVGLVKAFRKRVVATNAGYAISTIVS